MKWLNKKGADLSVNVIIVAIIALLVLVVLFAIFTGRMSWFNRGVNDVSSNCPAGTVKSSKNTGNCIVLPSTAKTGEKVYCCPTDQKGR